MKRYSMILALGVMVLPAGGLAQSPSSVTCPTPIEQRFQRHPVKAGETLDTIARRYQLTPATLRSVNSLQGAVRPGQTLLIPPFNGYYVTPPAGATWRDLANAYGIRADILFELNGCRAVAGRVFVPGQAMEGRPALGPDTYTGLTQWPLNPRPKVGLDYGWQTKAGETFFHSGLDLLAPEGTPVVAAASGQILLVSQEGPYGFLVVIDHGNGRQTRYAHLRQFTVSPGDRVAAGTAIGLVGKTGRPDIPEPHVHFEVRFQSPVGWAAQDPKLHLPR